MKLKEWLDDPSDYNKGVDLYKGLPKSNKVLHRYFDRGPSVAHINKLKYEISKHVDIDVPVIKTLISNPKKIHPDTSQNTYYLENLPVEIRPIRERAQIIYIEMRSLKLELNELAPQMEDAALSLQMQLWFKRKENISCWQQIDYFLQNKKMLPKAIDDLSNVSPARLLQLKANMHSQISNHKKTVEKNEKLLRFAYGLPSEKVYQRAINKSNDLILKKKVALTEIENRIYLNG